MSRGKALLVGGKELQTGCEDMDKRILRETGHQTRRVVFLPTAASHANPVESGNSAIAYFKRLGIQCEVAMILNRTDANDPVLAALVERATLVYLGGGDPAILLDVLQRSLVWGAALRAYERGAVVGGSSAGAMAVCSHSMLPSQRRPGQPAWVEALGLVRNVLVLPHFTPQGIAGGRNMAAGLARAVGPDMVVLGIPEQSALLEIDGESGAWEVIGRGPITVFRNGQVHFHNQADHISLRGSLAP